jgi:choloylglycine hydrolase
MKKHCFVLCLIGIVAIIFSFGLQGVIACTDVHIKAPDGTPLVARSLEFAQNPVSDFILIPRGEKFVSASPDGNKDGISWTNKYGYLCLNAFNLELVLDGLNEKGLSLEALYLPGFCEFQTVGADQSDIALSNLQFGNWILGNFSTVDEVRKALPEIKVFNQESTGSPVALTLHFAITQADGTGIVVEYVEGKLNIYDFIGVMTNSPPYDWQTINLSNYVNLSAIDGKPIELGDVKVSPTGQGSGLLGLPGDWTPPSRFVKGAFLANYIKTGDTLADAINAAQHILNSFDIPNGMSQEVNKGSIACDITWWVVIKDLKNLVYYYRTYNNLTMRKIELGKLDFSPGAKKFKMPIDGGSTNIIDTTNKFMTKGN